MGILKNLFRKAEAPNKEWSDEVLGSTGWSDDDEAWQGEYQGQRFSIAYEWASEPDPALVSYAREILQDPPWLAMVLEGEKGGAKSEYGEYYWEEIDGLSLGGLSFLIAVVSELDSIHEPGVTSGRRLFRMRRPVGTRVAMGGSDPGLASWVGMKRSVGERGGVRTLRLQEGRWAVKAVVSE